MDSTHLGFRVSDVALSCSGDTCASASVDGTVKVWRSCSNNNDDNKDDWRCAYSFKYRDSPVGSVCFSRDGSVLAVAHQHLLSLWDPVEVRVRATVVGEGGANHVNFLRIVEPDIADCDGGGSGQAFLVMGTKRSLSVVDLLTLSVRWTSSGSRRFSCFCVASSSSEARRSGGWIAAGSKESKDGVFRLEVFSLLSNEKKQDDEEEEEEVCGREEEIKALEEVVLQEKLTSVAFAEDGLLVASTEGCQVLLCRDRQSEQ